VPDSSESEKLCFAEHLSVLAASPKVSAADALAEAELRYRMIFEGAADAIFLVDVESLEIVDANLSACELFGYQYSEFIGRAVADISAEPEKSLATIRRGATLTTPRRMLKRSDGTTFVAEIYGTQIHYADRMVRASFIRDITSRLEMERARASSETKFALAFAASPDAVNINRLADGMYVEVNQGFTNLTGYTAEETVGRTSVEIEIWADVEQRAELVRRILADGFVDDFEADFRHRDGGIRPGSMSARIIDVDGVPHILSVTRDITELRRTAQELARSNTRLEEIVREVTTTLGRVVEIRDPYTFGHQERVASLCRAIAAEMGMDEADIEAVEMAALVHDVGKLAVPAEILNKPGKLSAVEFGLIQSHSERGHEILSGVAFPWPLAQIVLQHHERQDGSGYPEGLSGDDILLPARVLCIADVVEAMASYRPYRPALGLEAAIEEIRGLPQKFDADARAACLRLYERGDLDFLRDDSRRA
jgi:PAS domain S-box-containing protein/putative nucleotidyltransferase with HDIG domain